jgi:NitT/TauT family transport system ATP-binding protein
VAIVGPSGCGKSTLLSILIGLESLSHGRVLIDGQEERKAGPSCGMVFQGDTLFPWLTVLQNVKFSSRLQINAPEPCKRYLVDARAEKLIEAVGLSKFMHAYPKHLSGGMRQRCAIARALLNQPRILLMDEPFGALDAQTREAMQTMLLEVWEAFGTTILFVTHDVEEAVYLADRVVVLEPHPGRLQGIVAIDLPRPRQPRLKLGDDFQRLRLRLTSMLYHDQTDTDTDRTATPNDTLWPAEVTEKA